MKLSIKIFRYSEALLTAQIISFGDSRSSVFLMLPTHEIIWDRLTLDLRERHTESTLLYYRLRWYTYSSKVNVRLSSVAFPISLRHSEFFFSHSTVQYKFKCSVRPNFFNFSNECLGFRNVWAASRKVFVYMSALSWNTKVTTLGHRKMVYLTVPVWSVGTVILISSWDV